MSIQVNHSSSRFLGRVAIIALLASTAAGCSADVARFGGLFDSTDNRTATVPGVDNMATGSITPAPTAADGKLPPPPTTPPMAAAGSSLAGTALNQAASASGWSAAGGTPISVLQGETVASIAKRYGIPEDALRQVNKLQPGQAVAAGSSLIIPSFSGKAAVATLTQAPAQALSKAAGAYVVKAGDSLGKIANSYGLKSTELAAANGIDPSKPIKLGQKLTIPAMVNGKAVAAAQPVPPKPTEVPVTTTASTATPAKPDKPAVDNTHVASINTKPAANSVATGTGVQSAASGNFRWPVRGRVISSYGAQASGQRNDGINIEVPEGTPIKASEGGEVIYAGNELKGYGNLVLIKHPNGFVSAYAHASEILVRRGDVIMRGQTIGKVGATGNVDRPQLHFEIRNGNKPVDPIPHMG